MISKIWCRYDAEKLCAVITTSTVRLFQTAHADTPQSASSKDQASFDRDHGLNRDAQIALDKDIKYEELSKYLLT